MKLADLKNIIPLGVLADGVYPSGYNSKENEYENFKDDEEDIASTYPAIYLYYRNNGHLYLYRSKEEIEIDLTNVTAYDYTALFKFSDKVDVLSMTIDDFQHVTLDSNCYTFSNTWVKPSQRYLYILVPMVRAIHSITIQGRICTNIFSLHEVWTHDDKCYWVYRTDLKGNFDFNDEANAILEVKAYVKEITADELAPTVNLLQQLNNHINNTNNPHNVTPLQLGLDNVDNTPDIEKPVSNPQKEYIKQVILEEIVNKDTNSDHFKYYEFLSDYETAKANEEFVQPCIIYIEETDEVLYHVNKAQYMARFVWDSKFIENMNTLGMGDIYEGLGGIPLVIEATPLSSCIVNGIEEIDNMEIIADLNGWRVLVLKELPDDGTIFEIVITLSDIISLTNAPAYFFYSPVEEFIINDDLINDFKPLIDLIISAAGLTSIGIFISTWMLYTMNLKTLKLEISDASILGNNIQTSSKDYGFLFMTNSLTHSQIASHISIALEGVRPKLIIPADNPTYGSDDDPLDGSVINLTTVQRTLEQEGNNLFTLQRE